MAHHFHLARPGRRVLLLPSSLLHRFYQTKPPSQPTVLSAVLQPLPAQLFSHALSDTSTNAVSNPPNFPVPHPRIHALRNGDFLPAGFEPLYFLTPSSGRQSTTNGTVDAENTRNAEWISGRTFWNPLLPLRFGTDVRCFVRVVEGGVEREMGGREGWSLRERRELSGGEKVDVEIKGNPVFSRTFWPSSLLPFQFAALTYNADRRYWDRSITGG